MRLDPGNGLALVGSWTPAEWCDLDLGDNDLGGSGPLLLDFAPDGSDLRTFAVGGGKEGRLYSIETRLITQPELVEGMSVTALRGEFSVFNVTTPLPCRGSTPKADHHVMGGPVFWPRSSQGLVSIYLSVENDCVRGFTLESPGSTANKLIEPSPSMNTLQSLEGHPGAIMSLSAKSDTPGTGILWMSYALNPPGQNAISNTRRGRLAAYNAEDLSQELWNSDVAADERDAIGWFAKFNPPTIANGKVYVASFPAPEPYRTIDGNTYTAPNNVGYLNVYGLNPPARAPVRSFVADVLPSVLAPLLED